MLTYKSKISRIFTKLNILTKYNVLPEIQHDNYEIFLECLFYEFYIEMRYMGYKP